MHTHKRLVSLFILGVCLSQISCLRMFMPSGPDPDKLLEVVRQYSQNGNTASAARAVGAPTASSTATLEDEVTYRREIAATLNEWDFAKLDTEVREARASKGRVLGGVWKLNEFYDAVSEPSAGTNATSTEWINHFETLKQWKAAQPESAAAQIALAQAYVNYAWAVRGSGTSDTVSGSHWRAFAVNLDKAASTLVEAARLKEKCPYWYEVMQSVALGQGWSKTQARELFEQAAAFEPTYYHYYREYAYFLLPKWYGEQGETEAFAKEVADRVGGQQGDFIYFELATVTVCTCESDKPSMKNLSWSRIRSGYAALSQLYGISDQKANRYALMAYAEDDKASAREAFARVGDDRGEGVWRSQQSFEDTKLWAKSE
jgi:hypothetical protein